MYADGVDRDCNSRKRELTDNKNIRGSKYHMRIHLKDIFGVTQHQEKAAYGLGYKLTLTRASDTAVLNKRDATVIGKIKINSIE